MIQNQFGQDGHQLAEGGQSSLKRRSNISNRCSLIVLVVGILLIISAIILNAFFNDDLFVFGLNYVLDFQQSFPQQAIRTIQNILSILGSQGVTALIFIYYILIKRKLMVIIHIGYFVFCTYIIGIISQSLQQSRPFWYEKKIQNWDILCPMTFGSPSGHAFAIIVLYEPIVSDAIGYGKYKFMAIFLLILWVLIPLSRTYLGTHSTDQLLYGFVLGLGFLVIYKYYFQKYFYELCWNFFTKPLPKIKLLAVIILNAECFVIPIIFYYLNVAERPVQQRDLDNLNQQCSSDVKGHSLQSHIFGYNAIGGLSFGLLYGFLVLKDKISHRKYMLGLWRHQNIGKMILRLLVYIISAVLPFVGFYLIANFVFKHQPLLHYIFSYLATLLAGFGISCLTPTIAGKLGVFTMLDDQKQAEQTM